MEQHRNKFWNYLCDESQSIICYGVFPCEQKTPWIYSEIRLALREKNTIKQNNLKLNGENGAKWHACTWNHGKSNLNVIHLGLCLFKYFRLHADKRGFIVLNRDHNTLMIALEIVWHEKHSNLEDELYCKRTEFETALCTFKHTHTPSSSQWNVDIQTNRAHI